MYELFTDRARKVMQLANQEAQRLNHEYVGTEHVLLGLIKEGNGVAANVLKNLDVDLRIIRLEVEKLVPSGPDMATMCKLPQTPRAKKVIEYSMEEARQLSHNYVGTEHILLGLLSEQQGVAAQVLVNLDLKLEAVRKEVLSLLGENLDDELSSTPAAKSRHPNAPDPSIFRILDAAANRAAEGLRVVEDFTRFVLDDGHLTRLVKELRHELAELVATLPRIDRHAMRETQHDVGTAISTLSESVRTDAEDVCEASCERVKQSLRSLEEFSKTLDPETATRFESLRYRWYTLEKALTLTSRSRLSDVKLCVLIDGSFTTEKMHQLIDTGVGMIQLRDKSLDDRALFKRAQLLCDIARSPRQDGEAKCLVIINDRPDIALAVNADGVHGGQDDLSVEAAREILGPRKLIGVSTHNIEQARAAVLDGANYLGVGPTFPSTTKQFDEFPGTALLKQVAEEISLPAFAIGGITLENLPEVLATGIQRVAVSGAIAKAKEPGAVAKEFLAMQRKSL